MEPRAAPMLSVAMRKSAPTRRRLSRLSLASVPLMPERSTSLQTECPHGGSFMLLQNANVTRATTKARIPTRSWGIGT